MTMPITDRRRFLLGSSAALVAPATPALAQTVHLEAFYAWPVHRAWQEGLAERFTAQRPGIRITFRAPAPNYDEAVVSIVRQSLTRQQPDIHFVGLHLQRELVARELVQPLDDVIGGRNLEAEGYPREILALGQIGGRQHGMPWGISTPVVFVNADLVRQAGGDPDNIPSDWGAFIALAGRIARLSSDHAGMYWERGAEDWMTQNLIRNAGLELMTPDERDIGFDNAQGLAALTLFRRFHTEGGQSAIDMQAARQTFFAGRLGFYVSSTALVRAFSNEIGTRFQLRTARVPLLSPQGTMSTGGMAAVILSADAAKRRAAFDYIRFGTGAEGQAFVVRNTGYIPVNTGALRADLLGDFYRDNPNWYTAVTQIPRARPWFAWPGQNSVRIGRTMLDQMTALANNQKGPAQTLADMAREVRALLPRRA
jgi:multiple sugar transport system substrate-binding protein